MAPCLLPLLLFSASALPGKYGLKANNTHKFHRRAPHEKTKENLQQSCILFRGNLSIKLTHATQLWNRLLGPRDRSRLGFSYMVLHHLPSLFFNSRQMRGHCIFTLRWRDSITPLHFYACVLFNVYYFLENTTFLFSQCLASKVTGTWKIDLL